MMTIIIAFLTRLSSFQMLSEMWSPMPPSRAGAKASSGPTRTRSGPTTARHPQVPAPSCCSHHHGGSLRLVHAPSSRCWPTPLLPANSRRRCLGRRLARREMPRLRRRQHGFAGCVLRRRRGDWGAGGRGLVAESRVWGLIKGREEGDRRMMMDHS
jgi:hypothetical protein